MPALLIGLLGWRLIYYLLPLLLATAIWVVREARLWWGRRGRRGRVTASP